MVPPKTDLHDAVKCDTWSPQTHRLIVATEVPEDEAAQATHSAGGSTEAMLLLFSTNKEVIWSRIDHMQD